MVHSKARCNSLFRCRPVIAVAVSLLFLFMGGQLYAQPSQKLKTQRERILKEIKELDQALSASRNREKETLKQLELLERKLRLREEAIVLLRREADTLKVTAMQLDSASRAAGA